MRDKRKSPLLIFLLAISVVVLAVSYFFLPDGVAKPDTGLISIPWLSCAAALVCLAVTAASMGLLNYNDFLYTSDTKLLYLPYLLAALSVPGSMELSVWHIAALLILWAVFYAVRYLNSEQLRMDYIFGAMLMAGAASAIVPCLMYAQIFIFIHCLYRRGQEPLRHLLASLAGTALPWVCAAALAFFFPESFSIEGYAAFFKKCQEQGIFLGVITNGPGDLQRKKLHSLQLAQYIPEKNWLISGEVDLMKPQREIFEYYQKAHQLDQAIYVGDSFENDVVGANQVNWPVYWFNHRQRQKPANHATFKYQEVSHLAKLLMALQQELGI